MVPVNSDGDDHSETAEFEIRLGNGNKLFAREVISRADPKKSDFFVMIVVHGGPGLADHTESYSGLKRAVDKCQWEGGGGIGTVLFYDQLGCGQSDKPRNVEAYSLEAYTDELRQVVNFVKERHKGIPIVLLGHSWGGQLVLELLSEQEKRKEDQEQEQEKVSASSGDNTPSDCSYVKCAIISNSPLDEKSYERKQIDLRSMLDDEMRTFLKEDEERAIQDGSVGSMIYKKLIGTSETNITGELKGWSVLDRLQQLETPCLFITTKDDTIPHEEYSAAAKAAGDQCRAVVLDGGGHGPFFGDSADAYFESITAFIRYDCKK